MGKLRECTPICVCHCCDGKGDRVSCKCPCNKCCCARSKHKAKLSGGVHKKKRPYSFYTTTGFKVYEPPIPTAPPQPTHKVIRPKTSHNKPKAPQSTRPQPQENEYPKEVEEQMFFFSYNEELSKNAHKGNKPVKVDKVATEVDKEKKYSLFKRNVQGKLMRVKDGMWALPYYSTNTAKVSKAKWAIVMLDKETKACSCSCPHAEKLSKMNHTELKCWHVCYLQDHDEVPQEMHICVFKPTVSEDSDSDGERECEENVEDDNFVLDNDIADDTDLTNTQTGATRSGLRFKLSTISTENDDEDYHKFECYKLPDLLQWLVVDELQNFCWVFFSKWQQRLKCRTEHPNTPVHKHHAKAIQLWIEQNMDENWAPKQPQPTATVEIVHTFPLSYVPIQQQLSDCVRMRLRQETEDTCPNEFLTEEHLLPEKCNCGEAWKKYPEFFRCGTYFGLTFKKRVIVNCRRCINNKCTVHFDGQEQGIFNYSGETLVSYSLLKDYHNCCIKGGMSWSAYVEKMANMYNEVYCEQNKEMTFLSNPTFVKVLIAFMELSIKTIKNPYCPCCGQYPKKLIMDGTDAGLAFRHLLQTYRTWITDDSPESEQEVIALSGRCYIESSKGRRLLSLFCKDPEWFKKNKWKALVRNIRKRHPLLAVLVEDLCKELFEATTEATQAVAKKKLEVWIPLLKVLSSFNSICPLIPLKHVPVAKLLAKMQINTNIQQHKEFAQDCPILYNIVVKFNNFWPPEHELLLLEITKVCKAPFKIDVDPNSVEYRAKLSALLFWQEGHWYPHWERLRQCKKYSKYFTQVPEPANSKHRWRNYFEAVQKNHAQDGQCRKAEQGGGTNRFQVPGVFIVCCEHGVVYGYHIMIDPEGRKDLFYVLYERMPQNVLDELTVIYDFACNALEYCLNREPLMFKHTKFLVDRFHYKGHKCCRLFSMDHYGHLRKINSSILESINSFVQGFRQQLSQMNQRNFMMYLQYLFVIKNQDSILLAHKSVAYAKTVP